jgi:hypothetical protein
MARPRQRQAKPKPRAPEKSKPADQVTKPDQPEQAQQAVEPQLAKPVVAPQLPLGIPPGYIVVELTPVYELSFDCEHYDGTVHRSCWLHAQYHRLPAAEQEKRNQASLKRTVAFTQAFTQRQERRRKRPTEERNAYWQQLKTDGLSSEQIARRWNRRTGEKVTAETVKKALQRRR